METQAVMESNILNPEEQVYNPVGQMGSPY